LTLEQSRQGVVTRRSLGCAARDTADARVGGGAIGTKRLTQDLGRHARRNGQRECAEQRRQVTGGTRDELNARAEHHPHGCDQAV
jgi:hypothetical protein